MADSLDNMLASSDLCDLIIPSKRGAHAIQLILKEAAQDPDRWARHHFIVVFDFDTNEEMDTLINWYNMKREEMPLPVLHVYNQPELKGKLSSLRQFGLEKGKNPYVYFQDDDDPLPVGLNQRTKMMQHSDWDAVYGVTETVNARNHTVECFPPTTPDGRFLVDPIEGSKWFPTYAHPLAAVFRRRLFDRLPFNDEHFYKAIGNVAFFVRLLFGDAKIAFLADIIRRVRHHADNTTGAILSEAQRADIAHDIRQWLPSISNEDVKSFHEKVATRLEFGDVTTFKEIDSMVETRMERVSLGDYDPA